MGWYAFDGLYIHYRNNFWVNYVRNETKFVVVVVKKTMFHKNSLYPKNTILLNWKRIFNTLVTKTLIIIFITLAKNPL